MVRLARGIVGWGFAAVWAAGVAAAEPSPGRPVLDIRIQAGEVFDPARPGEDHFFFRWANAVHVRTRSHIIRRELLLQVGDPYDPALVAESARNLRAMGILQDVDIRAEETPEGVVLWVRTNDRWSTELSTEFRSQGGISQIGLGVSDNNLLGRAVEFGGSITSSTDLDSRAISWRDPRLLGTRLSGAVAYRDDEIVRSWRASVVRPFYAEAARWSGAADIEEIEGGLRRFESGDESERLEVDESLVDGYLARHSRGSGLERVGVFATHRRASRDADDDVGVVGLVWSRMQRQFHTVRDVDLLGAIEDVGTGWTVQCGAGADLEFLGGHADRPFVRFDAEAARFIGRRALVGARTRQHVFLESGTAQNSRLSCEAFGYAQYGRHQTFAWRAGAAGIVGEPRHLRHNLGGDDRLRGYEARHLSGERILYAGIEDRLFSDYRIFFFRLGGVVFADVATAWDAGEPITGDNTRLGAGVGLRLGANRSGSSVTGVDLAFGTHSIQVSISSSSFFRVARGLSFLDPRPFR